jgi:protein involved in sex pheromone biosynthesis
MKKTILLAAIPATLLLGACGESAPEQAAPTQAADDDNDAPEPVVEAAHDDAEPHDESVPHDH